eukprot:358052-Chlamydomonas_euryale.AAC.2
MPHASHFTPNGYLQVDPHATMPRRFPGASNLGKGCLDRKAGALAERERMCCCVLPAVESVIC